MVIFILDSFTHRLISFCRPISFRRLGLVSFSFLHFFLQKVLLVHKFAPFCAMHNGVCIRLYVLKVYSTTEKCLKSVPFSPEKESRWKAFRSSFVLPASIHQETKSLKEKLLFEFSCYIIDKVTDEKKIQHSGKEIERWCAVRRSQRALQIRPVMNPQKHYLDIPTRGSVRSHARTPVCESTHTHTHARAHTRARTQARK